MIYSSSLSHKESLNPKSESIFMARAGIKPVASSVNASKAPVLKGLACVLIIHGQGQHSATGEAVLREALPGWLTQGTATRHVLAFSPAPDRLGGNGATLVLLRRSGPLR